MLKGQKLVYIRHQEIKGKNATTGNEYAFANMTLSDGLESVEIPLEFNLVPDCNYLKKGDKLDLDVEVIKRGNNTNIKIVKFSKAV